MFGSAPYGALSFSSAYRQPAQALAQHIASVSMVTTPLQAWGAPTAARRVVLTGLQQSRCVGTGPPVSRQRGAALVSRLVVAP